MPTVEEIAVLAPAIAALIAAIAGLWKMRGTAKTSDLDTLREIIGTLRSDNEALRADNQRLSDRVTELGELVTKLQEKNTVLSDERDDLKNKQEELSDRLRQETNNRVVLTDRVAELAQENKELHQYIGELRQSIRDNRTFPPETSKIMQRASDMCTEVAEYAAEVGCNSELMDRILCLVRYCKSIPGLIEELRREKQGESN